MDNEKKLTISVDASAATKGFDDFRERAKTTADDVVRENTRMSSSYEEIKRSAEQAADELIKDAETRKGSSRDVIQYLEEEIKLLERQSRADNQKRIFDAQSGLRDDPDNKEFQKELENAKFDDKEAKLQTELLRELIETIKIESRREITENREAVEARLASTPKEAWTAKDRLQARMLAGGDIDAGGGDIDAGGGNSRYDPYSRYANEMRNVGGMMMGSNNQFDMMFSGMGMGGNRLMGMGGKLALAGGGLLLGGMLAKKLFESFQAFEKAEGAGYAITGSRLQGDGTGFDKWGYSGVDYAESIATLARTRRSGKGIEQSAAKQLLLERAIGLDRGTYGSMDQLSLINGESGYGNIQSAIAAMKASGIVKGNDMSAVPDYLSIMVQLSREQLTRLGKVDVGVNTKMVAALANMDENLKKSPEALSTLVNAMRSGLMQSSSPQVQALQFSVLSRMRPGASMFELMEMQEDPFSEKSKDYMPDYLKELHKMSGGNRERFMMNIKKQFGLSASMSRMLGEGFLNGNLQEVLDKDFKGKTGLENAEQRAEDATSLKEQANARMENLSLRTANAVEKTGEVVDKWFKKTFSDPIQDAAVRNMQSKSTFRQYLGSFMFSKTIGL